MSANDATTAASSGNSTGRPHTFTCFTRLPLELRNDIWKFSAFIPRNIDLLFGYTQFSHLNGTAMNEGHYFYSTVPPPAILHTCREARLEGLKVYKLGFGAKSFISRPNRPTFTISSEPRIYLNRHTDTICIVYQGDPRALCIGEHCDLAVQVKDNKLAHLAINMRCPTSEFRGFTTFLWLIFNHTRENVNEYIIFESHYTPAPEESLLEFVDIDEVYLYSTLLSHAKRWFDEGIEMIKEQTRDERISENIPQEEVDACIRNHDWWKVRMCELV